MAMRSRLIYARPRRSPLPAPVTHVNGAGLPRRNAIMKIYGEKKTGEQA